MENATTIAVTKGVKAKIAKEARGNMNPGSYDVDTTVRIKGTLKVGEDRDIAATASILNKEFLVLVLHNAGITRKAAARVIEEVAGDYLTNWTGSDEDKDAAKAARKAKVAEFDPEGKIAAIFDGFKDTLPRIPSKGKVTWKGNVEEITNSVEIEIGTSSEELVA